MMEFTMERTFHPVGHGAFYTERFTLPDRTYNIVYDCGCFEAAKEGMSREKYRERIYSEIDSCFKENDVIDALFISHFHTDHILGVTHLVEKCDIKRIVLPQLTGAEKLAMFLEDSSDLDIRDSIDELTGPWKTIFSQNNRVEVLKDDENGNADNDVNLELIQNSIKSGDKVGLFDGWYLIPYNSPISDDRLIAFNDAVEHCFPHLLKGNDLDFNQLWNYIKEEKTLSGLKDLYKDNIGDNRLNETSMTLYSGMLGCTQKCERHCGKAVHYANRYCALNCLYLGDFEAKKQAYFNGLMEVYKPYFKHIGIIQVPHHGSNNNYNTNLYSSSSPDKSSILHKIGIVSADSIDKYGHPDEDVLDGIRKEGGITILVTEFPKTKQVFRIRNV